VLEQMQTGIYIVDCDQKIQFWNDGAEIITGHLRQDVVGHSCQDFFPPQKEAGKNGVGEIGGPLASVLRDGRPATAEVTLRHKAGHQVMVRVRVVPIRDRAGGVIGAAESMDADLWAIYADRRHRELASFGCLDEATGVLSAGYIHTHLCESLTTFADQRLRKPNVPLDPSNRRISVLVQHMAEPPDAKAAGGADATTETKAADEKVADATKPTDVPAAQPASPPHGTPTSGDRRHLSHRGFQVG
jgi:PAS domain S-box-containing protein